MITVFKNARLFDGTGSEPADGATVVVDGTVIQSVLINAPDEGNPGGANVVDLKGRLLMPALTDTHVGFTRPVVPEYPDPYQTKAKYWVDSALRAVVNGQKCLAAGITTVRQDSASDEGIYALKEAYATGLLEGPRVVVPGQGITMTGGHAWYECHEADGEDEVRRVARLQLKAGADWIKLMATAGSGGSSPNESPEQPQMTLEEMRAGVEEAHKKGRFAMAHVSCAEGARTALKAGVDSVEHGLFLEEDIVADMAERGVFLIPTLWLYTRLVEEGEQGRMPQWKYERAKGVVPLHARSFQIAMEAGVKIAAGSDAGSSYTPLGESLFHELEYMHALGMSRTEVLVSATRRAAECLRFDKTLGTVEVGKTADLLILDGDPTKNISDIRKTWHVYKEGRLVHDNSSASAVA